MHEPNAQTNSTACKTSKLNNRSANTASATPSTPTNPSTSSFDESKGLNKDKVSQSNILYLNIQNVLPKSSNRRKLEYLKDRTNEENVKMIVMTESHLSPEILDDEIKIPHFNVFRSDREERRCGGVLILLHETFLVSTSDIVKFSNSVCELLVIYIEKIKLHLICVYRPPDTRKDEFTPIINQIDSYLSKISSVHNVMIVGDFNFPFLAWYEAEDTVIYRHKNGANSDEKIQAEMLLNLTDKYLLNQIITQPTRLNNTLDLVFLNSNDLIHQHHVEKISNSISDHDLINCEFNETESMNSPVKKKPEKLRNFNYWSKKSQWENMNSHLKNVKWSDIITETSGVKEDIDNLYNEIYSASEKYIPIRKSQNYKHIPRDRKILFRRSKFLKQKLLSAKNESKITKINEELVEIQAKLLKSHENERIMNEKNLASEIKKNAKLFFKYANKFRKTKDCIGPLKDKSGNFNSDPKIMCEILKEQFEQNFNTQKCHEEVVINDPKENEIELNELFNSSEDDSFTQLEVTRSDILSAIKATKINSAAGPDTIPPILLHNCAENLVEPLRIIMNKSLKNGEIPDIWKQALITPIYKRKGNKWDSLQYRPISLTSQIVKLLERIIRTYLIHYLEINHLLPESQHGFRPNRSTVSQLLEQYDQILDALGNKYNIDIIMLDYSKAFDKINHSILLFKLKKLGISGQIGKWIGNFLLNRTQHVTIDGEISSESHVISGVPQGTILGPVLFLIYIADIGDCLTSSNMASYADDSKLLNTIKSWRDNLNLKLDLSKIYNWTNINLMEFNSTKFEVLKIGKNEDLKDCYYENPEGQNIPEVTTAKDLGINFNNNGDFSDHILIKTSKAKQMSGYILRTFMIRNPEPLMLLFKSLVLPHLEYCVIVWNPYLQKEITMLEQIQRSFTSKLEGLNELNYYQRLKKLDIYSLERRRDRYIILYIFKILNNIVPNPGLSYKYSARRGKILTTPSVTASNSHAATLIHNSFIRRAPRIFNSLPKDLRDSSGNMITIKKNLDKFLRHIPDEPKIPGCFPTNSAISNKLEDQMLILEFSHRNHQ